MTNNEVSIIAYEIEQIINPANAQDLSSVAIHSLDAFRVFIKKFPKLKQYLIDLELDYVDEFI